MTHRVKLIRAMVVPVQAASCWAWQANPSCEVSSECERTYGGAKSVESSCQEIISKGYKHRGTVPQTDTGRRAENAKAYGRIRVKELGKMHT